MSRPEIHQFGNVLGLLNLHHTARLFWALQMDGRVSPLLKVQSWCGLVYFLSPLDFLPDYFTGVGLLDDIILCLILLQSFVELAPRPVVEQHCMRLDIDINKVFVNVPRTVQEAKTLYNWAMNTFSDIRGAPTVGRGSDDEFEESEEAGDDPVSAEAPRYQRYSAYRPEEG